MNLFNNEEAFDELKLNSKNQQKLAMLVKALPEEDLSMSWRSSLNVKLMAAQAAKSKKRTAKKFLAWGTSLSAGVAATAYFVILGNVTPMVSPTTQSDSVAFASELVKTHQESVVMASVSGIGSASIHETSITEDSYSSIDDLL
jgi:glucosamine 6-phosphate synthetase-like amidotransferase/phosphosugar isomerase protein